MPKGEAPEQSIVQRIGAVRGPDKDDVVAESVKLLHQGNRHTVHFRNIVLAAAPCPDSVNLIEAEDLISFTFLFSYAPDDTVNTRQGIMVCLSEVFGVDAVLVFLEDFIVAFLLTAGDATVTEFFVADSGLNSNGTAIPNGNTVLFGNVADSCILLILRHDFIDQIGMVLFFRNALRLLFFIESAIAGPDAKPVFLGQLLKR